MKKKKIKINVVVIIMFSLNLIALRSLKGMILTFLLQDVSKPAAATI
jgi:hypothetical protein